MGWSIGEHNGRDIGYGVPAKCDHPGCDEDIHRGLAYVCGGEPYGGDFGCGLFFCEKHLYISGRRKKFKPLCIRCSAGRPPFDPTPDTDEWVKHKLIHESWAHWRLENAAEVADMMTRLRTRA